MDKVSKKENEASDNIAQLRLGEEKEPIARFLKTKLVELTPGYAKVVMKLLPDHQNFNGLVFGGIIMAVADQAFAYASNSLIQPSLASQFNIHFFNSPGVGDELTAECWVVKSGRRVGISEMKVTNQEGKTIAKATGTTIPRPKESQHTQR
jgi:acyl-CoA thioesterase